MADDFITANTGIATRQLRDAGSDSIVSIGGFLLTDIILTSTSRGQTTIVASDGAHTHIIAVLSGPGTFNHAFTGGWAFWKNAELLLIKELDNGEVNVAVGFTPWRENLTYEQWLRKGRSYGNGGNNDER